MRAVPSQGRSYGGRTADERIAERRERLIASTISVLAEHGETRTTMSRICNEAGLSERYFYENFQDLDDALLTALDAVCTEILTLAIRTIKDVGGSPQERMHAGVEAVVDLVVAEPAKASVAVIHASANPRLRARRHELIGVFGTFVGREGARLYGDSAWPPERALLQGIAAVAGFAEIVAAWLSGDVQLSRDDLVEVGEDLFRALLLRP